MSDRTITTEDGKVVREGDRVFNYYDGFWGTLGPIDDGGWADVFGDGRKAYLNGQRISTFDPKGSTDPEGRVYPEGTIERALLRDLKAAQKRYESAYRECSTEENEAADEFFEHFDRLVRQLGWADTWKDL